MTDGSRTSRPPMALLALSLFAVICLVLAARPGDVAAASTVSWSPCHGQIGPFECASVRVPLDYDRPHGERIPIALARLRATDPQRRIGSLFVNPGGPGGSGVDEVLGLGRELFTPEVRARFDIVGFDPRGIGRSSGLRCFGTPKQSGQVSTPFAFPLTADEQSAKARADRNLHHACEQRGTRVIDHMSTANVARDMDELRRSVGDRQLTFHGASYGSYVGVTYANMFPDRVRAVVVDGIIDPIGWSTGRGDEALTLPVDSRLRTHAGAQATLDEFFRLCDEAGEACALSGGAAARFAALAERARQGRLTFVFPDGFTVEGGYSDLIGLTLGAMYSSTVWPEFAQVLADVEATASPALAGARLGAFMAKYGTSLYPNFVEGGTAVLCEDSDNPDTYAAWSLAGAQADRTSYFGRIWTWLSSPCAEWKAFDADRYMGPFDKPTANPVLVVGSRFDPATPYEDAVTVDELMPDSALLTVNGWGHTSLFMSRCADTAVERYLVDIETPPAGAECDQDAGPFETTARSTSTARKRVQALSYINRHSPQSAHAARLAGGLDGRGRSQLSGAGARRSDPSDSASDALGAQVAVDDADNAVYAWSSSDTANAVAQVRTRTRSATGRLGPIVALSDPAVEAFDVRVAVNGSGAAVFSWLQLDAASGVVGVRTRSRSARGVLGPIAGVSGLGADALAHDVAISDAGRAVITWTDVDHATSALRAQARTRSAAGTLGAVIAVADPNLDSFGSRVAIDAGGDAMIAWTQGDAATRRTRVQARSLAAGGQLGPVVDISDATRNASDAQVAVDRDGDAVFGWLAFDDARPLRAVQSRSRSRQGALGPIVELSDPADDAWDPVVDVDDGGNAVLAWWVSSPTGARVETRSRPAHGSVGPRATLSNASDDGYEPTLAVDADGDAVFTWLAFDRDGVRVQARSRSRRGMLGPLTDLSRRAQDAFSARVAVGDDGDAAYGWSALNAAGYEVQGRSRSAKGRLGATATISSSRRDAFDALRERTFKHIHSPQEFR